MPGFGAFDARLKGKAGGRLDSAEEASGEKGGKGGFFARKSGVRLSSAQDGRSTEIEEKK